MGIEHVAYRWNLCRSYKITARTCISHAQQSEIHAIVAKCISVRQVI